MSNNNTDTDTSMSNAVHSALQDAGSKAPAAAADESGTKRKRPKPSDATSSHVAVFHATAAGPQTAEQLTAGLAPTKTTYAIALAAPKVPPAAKQPTAPTNDKPSVCLNAMIAGAQMLRTATVIAPVSPSTPTTALPAFGILIKSVHYNKKVWRHYALFGCTEIEITAGKNLSYPEALNPTLHPRRMVCIRSDLLDPKTSIDASFLHVVTGKDMQQLNDIKHLSIFLPEGFGKIHYAPTGMHIKLMSSTYKYGPDDRHTYLRPIYDHVTEKHLLIPVSKLHLLGKDYPILEDAVLAEGTHVNFRIGIDPKDGGSFAFNLRLVTILPFDNCYGSPPQKLDSLSQKQPGGFHVDLHVAPFGVSLRSERCDLLAQHVRNKIPTDTIGLYITHTNNDMLDPHFVSVGQLDRAFRNSPLKCSWNLANLDQIVEMILLIKNNAQFNDHKAAEKHFTIIFTLANQNQQNIVTKTIAESYNTHKYAGHALLNPSAGVILVLQPSSHSNKGIVAQVNAAQILSKAHCSSLHSTHTYPPGYSVPYVKDTGADLKGAAEPILGRTHTFLSILIFADEAKNSKLWECLIDIKNEEVDPIKITNEVIPIQWQPGSLNDDGTRNPILNLLADKDFLMQAEVNHPKKERKKKHEKIIRTAYIKPKPGYNQSVLATLQLHKDILILPDQALDEDGFLLRFSRPYPAEAFELAKHKAAKFTQFLSPYALRFIYNDGYDNGIIPELLKLDKTVAHTTDNISLAPAAGSPWNEVIANELHSTLGRALLPPIANCPNSTYIGGFTGFPTTQYLQYTLFEGITGKALLVVDTPEETKDGGVFVQYLKSSIRPSSLHAKDTTISIFTHHTVTKGIIKDMTNLISHLTLGSLFPVTSGLQFLTVQATAVSTAKGDAMSEEALSVVKSKIQDTLNADDVQQDAYEPDHQPQHDEEEEKEGEFVEHRSKRPQRSVSKKGNTHNQQAKSTNTSTSNNQQARKIKANQFLSLGSDDDEVFNDPAIVAAATHSERKADAGDFDTTKDWRITGYLADKWRGYRSDAAQNNKIAKLVVTIWARDHPNYHDHQLGNNFTGAKKLGGLLSSIGRSSLPLKQFVKLLNDNVRTLESVDSLCKKLDNLFEDAKANPPAKQTQQQPTNQPPAPSTNKQPQTQPIARPSNKTTTTGTTNKAIITNFFNPVTNIVDLANSQPEEDTADMDHKHAAEQFVDSMVDLLSDDDDPPAGSAAKSTPHEPTNAGTNSASDTFTLHGGLGGMPSNLLLPPEGSSAI